MRDEAGSSTILVAIVGGSGAGKTWLADQLHVFFYPCAGRLSLDSFYLDRSHLPPKERESLNFDHLNAIDWPVLENVLRAIKTGQPAAIPNYDFKTHCRLDKSTPWLPKDLVIVDGLWLLQRAEVWKLFDLTIFLDCERELRFSRRLARDQAERGRTEASIRRQFQTLVAPMHDKFVAPQKPFADLVFEKPLTDAEVGKIAQRIKDLAPLNSQSGSLRKTLQAVATANI